MARKTVPVRIAWVLTIVAGMVPIHIGNQAHEYVSTHMYSHRKPACIDTATLSLPASAAHKLSNPTMARAMEEVKPSQLHKTYVHTLVATVYVIFVHADGCSDEHLHRRVLSHSRPTYSFADTRDQKQRNISTPLRCRSPFSLALSPPSSPLSTHQTRTLRTCVYSLS